MKKERGRYTTTIGGQKLTASSMKGLEAMLEHWRDKHPEHRSDDDDEDAIKAILEALI